MSIEPRPSNEPLGRSHEVDHERLELLDMLLEAAHDGFLDWHIKPSSVHFSPRLKVMLGYEDDELPTSRDGWIELTHPSERGMLILAISELVSGDWPFDLVCRVKHRVTGWRWLRCRAAARRDEAGAVARIVAMFSDVSDTVRAERRQASLISAIPDLLLRVQSDSTVIDFKKPEGDSVYTLPAPKPGDKLASSPFTSGWTESAMQALAAAVNERRASQFETRIRTSGEPRQTREIEVRVFPSADDESLFVLRDITTEKGQREQGLQSQKLEAIGQLAAGIAHEINTPLQFVGDNLHFLADVANTLAQVLDRYRASVGEQTAKELREVESEMDVDYMLEHLRPAFSAAIDGVERVRKIVQAMKSFSHPEATEKQPEDLNQALETTIIISTNVWKYVAEIERDFDLDLPKVSCTVGSLNQVFLNLITNAAHAIASVVGDSGTKGRIHISTRHDAESVEIRFRDTGAGIPDAVRSRIFEPFFTTKPIGQGTGQGLALARSIVRQHQGSIEFETEEGVGTTFLVRLPLHPAAPVRDDLGPAPIA